ncbi:helix-turn-helix domain-containing protein [Paenibacillus thalictri]|uniref:Helix-turn-helix domain-containing protein n=1 Tax=Paenibacillus thalictri TaxID=2527873 RepID=A0A4Q9DPU5_9BACL|nr:helix-turn-helix domain-containing protein [Paenibacillus thalictri]TBL75986.1 hypothetical protein EYB31_20720 [Paenibacillus thalictri]
MDFQKKSTKKNENFFLKSTSEKNKVFEELKESYGSWKKEIQAMNKPFFAIHSDFKQLFLKDLSGGALKLYLYLGFHAKYYTGELWHTSEEISSFFGKDQRTIGIWFKELEDRGLIFREQKGFRMKANTFLKPYGFTFTEINPINSNHLASSIVQNIEASKKLGFNPQMVLILNHSLKEYTILVIYKNENNFICSYFLNFLESEIKILRYNLKNLSIKCDNLDIEHSLNSSKNKELSLYTLLQKYLDEE